MEHRVSYLHLLVLHTLLWQYRSLGVAICHARFNFVLVAPLYVLHDSISDTTMRQWVQTLTNYLLGLPICVQLTTEFDICLNRYSTKAIWLHPKNFTLFEELRVNLVVFGRHSHLWKQISIHITNFGESTAGRSFTNWRQVNRNVEAVSSCSHLQQLIFLGHQFFSRLQIKPAQVSLDLDVLSDGWDARTMCHMGRVLLSFLWKELSTCLHDLLSGLFVHLLVAILIFRTSQYCFIIQLTGFYHRRMLPIDDSIRRNDVQGACQRTLVFTEVVVC